MLSDICYPDAKITARGGRTIMYSGHRRPLKGNGTGAASQVVRNTQPKHHGGESLSARETAAPLPHETDMDAFQK